MNERTGNILPPPDDLTIPIVKLLTHQTYHNYQSQTAALSLFENLCIKFLPPSPTTWRREQGGGFDRKEWKRRIKMYSTSLSLSFLKHSL